MRYSRIGLIALFQVAPLLPAVLSAQALRVDTARIAMPDGPALLTEIYLPTSLPAPVVLARTPYGSDNLTWLARALVPAGYAVVLQNVRGTHGSDGAFIPFVFEQRDGQTTLEWVLAQPWATDTVGLFGISYSGYAVWTMAELGVPAVQALVVLSGWSELDEFIAPGGAFSLMAHLPWFISFGRGQRMPPSAVLDSLFRVAPLIAMFRGAEAVMDLAARPYDYARADLPVLHVSGWYDYIYPHTLRTFAALRARPRHGGHQRLIVGPWAHNDVLSGRTMAGDEDFGPAARAGFDSVTAWTRRWFDEHLRGQGTAEPPVRLFVLGENRWHAVADWPPPDVAVTPWHLASDRRLAAQRVTQAGADSFVYDPNDPVPTIGGANTHFLPERLGPQDQRPLDARGDVVRFTSEPLAQELVLAGPLEAVLYVATDAPSTDITAKLVALLPDGRARLIEEGIRRLRPASDTVMEVVVAMGATAIRLPRGTRLRVDVSGGNFPKYDRNPNTGEDPLEATVFTPVRLSVHFGGETPSRVLLPVWPGPLGHSR